MEFFRRIFGTCLFVMMAPLFSMVVVFLAFGHAIELATASASGIEVKNTRIERFVETAITVCFLGPLT